MDNNIINIYDAQMAVNSSALAQFTAFVFNGIGVIKNTISEKELHGAIEFGIAHWKKDIELCDHLTQEEKEEKKSDVEATFRGLESMLRDSLMCRNKVTK